MSRPACVNGRIPDAPPAPSRPHPLATVRTRNTRTFPEGMELAPCAHCGADMPAARHNLPLLEGQCSTCYSDRLKARPAAPVYETEAWSRGERL